MDSNRRRRHAWDKFGVAQVLFCLECTAVPDSIKSPDDLSVSEMIDLRFVEKGGLGGEFVEWCS